MSTDSLQDLFPPLDISPLDLCPSTTPPEAPVYFGQKVNKSFTFAGMIKKKEKKSQKTKKRKWTPDDIPNIYADIVELLTRDDLFILTHMANLIKRAEVDIQSRIFVKLLQSKGGNFLVQFLHNLIKKEVEETQSEGTLFRDNNMCVAMMSSHARTVGLQYLIQFITPLIEEVRNSENSLEIDPEKIENPSPEIIERGEQALRAVLDSCLSQIIGSLEEIPADIRNICYMIRESTKFKYPNSLHTCIGGFYFLRFICPALVAPDGFKIIKEPLAITERRPFVLISKTIQNLSNDTLSKEDFMISLNSWITENTQKVKTFFDGVPAQNEPDDYSDLDTNITEYEIKKLISILERNMEHLQEASQNNLSVQEYQYDPISSLSVLFEHLAEAQNGGKKKNVK